MIEVVSKYNTASQSFSDKQRMIESVVGYASYLTLPQHLKELFSVIFFPGSIRVVIKDEARLCEEIFKLTGFEIIYTESELVSDEEYKELLDQNKIPISRTNAHDILVHVLPGLNIPKENWLLFKELSDEVCPTHKINGIFEIMSIFGSPKDPGRVIIKELPFLAPIMNHLRIIKPIDKIDSNFDMVVLIRLFIKHDSKYLLDLSNPNIVSKIKKITNLYQLDITIPNVPVYWEETSA